MCLKAGAAPMTAASLREHWAAKGTKLAPFKMPASVFVWPEPQLPRGATGKIPKKEIRARVLAPAPRSKL